MPLPITALYAGFLGLLMIALTMRVVSFRWSEKVSLGDGGSSGGTRLIRAHGNAAETVPIFLILLALAEGMGWSAWWLHCLGAAFLAGRVAHGLHFQARRKGLLLRSSGMLLSMAATLALALGLIRTVLFDGALGV